MTTVTYWLFLTLNLSWSLVLIIFSFKSERKLFKLEEARRRNKIEINFITDNLSRLNIKRSDFDAQLKIISEQIHSNLKKEALMEKRLQDLKRRQLQMINMSEAQLKKEIFTQFREKLKNEFNQISLIQLKEFRESLHAKTVKIVCSALERYATSLIFNKNVDSLVVHSKSVVSKIIGKDGKNITLFRRLTGTDVIFEGDLKNNNESSPTVIKISSFDSLRREISLQTLKKVCANEQKITPLYIEKNFEETKKEVEGYILKAADEVLSELNITNLDQELVWHLGKLKYRTSYGQNVLEHSLEVAKLSGTIASEIGLDSSIARRAGLLHDIGKSTDDLIGISHVTSGVALAKKFHESEIVINAIASHHDKLLADNPYSLIVAVADALSAGRPGSRSKQLESYLVRMKKIESLAKDFNGIKKIYSFQAGREIWVIVDSNRISDLESFELSSKIRKEIEEKIIIPGDVVISVVREKIFRTKVANAGRVNSSDNFKKKEENER